MLSRLYSLVRLSEELAEAELTVGDERAHTQLGHERERLPGGVPGMLTPPMIDSVGAWVWMWPRTFRPQASQPRSWLGTVP